MQLSVLSLLLSLGAVYFLTLTHRVLKNPLSSLPGPEVTKWTDLILKYHTVTGQRPGYVHALHQKYGPIVRIAPNTVDIADIPAARSIHRIASPFLKAPWYRLLNRKDGESIFSTTDPAFHRRHRRLLAPGLTDAALRTVEPLVKSRIQLAVRRIRGETRLRGAADVYKWFLFMATDVIGELSFGESFRMLEKGVKDQYVMDLETVARIGGVRATFPVVVKLSGVIRLGVFREVVDSTDRILEYARVSVERYKRCLAVDPEAKKTLFTKLYAAGQAREKQGENECLSDGEIRNDAQSFIVAGSDTTANTLTYLVWSVLRDKQVQERLVAEIDGLFGRVEEVSDILLRGLPYLNQVIDETLRLYPAVPSGLPRIVPEQGSMLAGYWIPGGATVTTQLYSLHRDPEVFADPERFHPSRWASPTKAMKEAFMPFGAGSRNCIGIHLARMELRLATAFFFRAFPQAVVSTRESMSDGDMEMMLYFLLSPKGKRCLVETRNSGLLPLHDRGVSESPVILSALIPLHVPIMDNTASRRAIVWTRVTDIPGCPQDRHAALGESFCRRVLGRELMSTVPYFRHDRAPDCYDHVHIPWYFDSEEPRNAFFVIDLAVRGRIAREDNGRIPYTVRLWKTVNCMLDCPTV